MQGDVGSTAGLKFTASMSKSLSNVEQDQLIFASAALAAYRISGGFSPARTSVWRTFGRAAAKVTLVPERLSFLTKATSVAPRCR
jgi:hypothetical protein